MYGYQDSKELASDGGKFGLNSGAFVTKFEYNANAGQNESAQDAIDFTVTLGDKKYMSRFFPVTKVFATKGGGELTDTTTDEYKKELNKAVAQLNATLSDIVRCFVDEADLKAALAAPISSFKDYAEILQRLVHSVPNFDKQPVDIFLQYQWTPKGDNKVAFLELPKNVKHGTFVVKSFGEMQEERTASSIKWFNDSGITHPFKRGEWFLGSAFANQSKIDGGSSAPTAPMGGAASPTTW